MVCFSYYLPNDRAQRTDGKKRRCHFTRLRIIICLGCTAKLNAVNFRIIIFWELIDVVVYNGAGNLHKLSRFNYSWPFGILMQRYS